ncbi:MAG TPA: MinD/ParA family protein [Gammaproteobacteria bacterium]|nr:MinD/ParA family protein [Gammaproteobacteria bacterium]
MRSSEDQAAGLRRIVGAAPVKVMAVASGKGGVGKTHVAVNLAVALAESGRATMLLDADLGLANVDVLLGLRPAASLEQVFDGELPLEEVVVEGPSGLKIVPASSGVSRLAGLSPREIHGLVAAFSSLPLDVEALVVDTATGIGGAVLGFCGAAHEVVVVVCDEPASITDAYAVVKLASRERGVRRFQILCNRVRNTSHGRALFEKLRAVCDRFLDVSLVHFGSVPEDPALHRAVRLQKAVVESFPSSPSGRAFKELAGRADKWVVPESCAGRPVFFLERTLAAARAAPACGSA